MFRAKSKVNRNRIKADMVYLAGFDEAWVGIISNNFADLGRLVGTSLDGTATMVTATRYLCALLCKLIEEQYLDEESARIALRMLGESSDSGRELINRSKMFIS